VLADEPTAALDSSSGRIVLDLLRHLARRRDRAVVIVTHDARATRYADRIVSIEDGHLREGSHDDSPELSMPVVVGPALEPALAARAESGLSEGGRGL